jgi:hypothetical protein
MQSDMILVGLLYWQRGCFKSFAVSVYRRLAPCRAPNAAAVGQVDENR